MKKFFTQQINFVYAVIVMLALVTGVGAASAVVTSTSSGYGIPGEIPLPIIHQGGGAQAIDTIRLGECPIGAPLNAPCNPIGAFDTRGPAGAVTLFDGIVSAAVIGVLNDSVHLGTVYIAQDVATALTLWTSPQGTNNLTAPIQSVNVNGDVLTTSLTNSGGDEVCVTNDGDLIICPNLTTGSCGASAGHSYTNPPTSNLCSAGTASSVTTNISTYDWNCIGSGGTVACQANRLIPVNGSCGPAAGHNYNSPPTSGLCSAGSTSAVTTNTNSYDWTCNGIYGGTNDICTAGRTTAVDGQCTVFSSGPYTSQPANSGNGCIAGVYNDVTEGIGAPPPWKWECLGINTGNDTTCFADAAPAGNPSCKPYSGNWASQPATNTTNGCDVGTYADVTDTSSLWKWTCTDNSITTNCSANKDADTGYLFVCGTDPNGSFGPTGSAPNDSRWAQWTRGGVYNQNSTGDEYPFSMGSPDCSNPTTIPFWQANPWSLPNGNNPSNPVNDGYDGTVVNPGGQGDQLYWKYFCLDAAPSDCFCNTAGANEQMC